MKKSTVNRFKNLLFIISDYALYFKKTFARAFAGAVVLCFFFGINLVVNGQFYGFSLVDPYAPNGCFYYNDKPTVHETYFNWQSYGSPRLLWQLLPAAEKSAITLTRVEV